MFGRIVTLSPIRASFKPFAASFEAGRTYSSTVGQSTTTVPPSEVEKKEPTLNANKPTQVLSFGLSPVYDGVARDLGYKVKNGGFQ